MRFACPTLCRRCGMLLVLAAGWQLSIARLSAADGRDVLKAASGEVDRLIADLDEADFATRNHAAARLEALAGKPALAVYLSRRFRGALLSGETSFEARSRLEPLVRVLPAPPVGKPKPSASQIVPLLDQLAGDSYAERDSAARRLRSMLAHVELIGPLWLELKRRTVDPQLPAADRRALEPLCEAAREAWLLAPAGRVPLPKPSAGEISRWIDELSRLDEAVPTDRHRRELARRELLDLIVRDDTRPQVLEMLVDRIASDDESARGTLQELVDFSRGGMAAEVWLNQTNVTVQYLIIGQPQYNDTVTARKATHFDRIDDETAHCVSGNSLNPGDYPVRVALPHPMPGHETMFYLTNLPTPRRRLAYEYHLKRDERLRLQEISQRTLDYYLRRRVALGENEVLMLSRLDRRSVSRFVGAYFETVPNAPLLATLNGITSQPTVHGALAAMLSQIGTHEAVPALARLARSGALGKPTYENRLNVAWVAALAIAGRDPWPGIDRWLADLLDERLPLTIDPDAPPELGASAAGLLLDRHGASTRPFGLHTANESLTNSFRFIGYRFGSERDRQDVKRWWQKQKALADSGRAARLIESGPDSVRSINPGAGQRPPQIR